MECIVLAGGFGTRLRGVIGEQPKCMAPVNGRPFLYYLFSVLQRQSCKRVILSLGYKYEEVLDWLSSTQWAFETDYVIEQEPLGTGGGIRLALQKAEREDVFVLNGDTLFDVPLADMHTFHAAGGASVTIALKPMTRFERYGSVILNGDTVLSFEEKKYKEEGLINGGVYIVNKKAFLQDVPAEKCSFEKDYLEKRVQEGKFAGYRSKAYFIDIGIPDDYEKAQADFRELFKD